jgi:hypothetical protein
MLYAGLDLSRKRLDFHLLDSEGVDGSSPSEGSPKEPHGGAAEASDGAGPSSAARVGFGGDGQGCPTTTRGIRDGHHRAVDRRRRAGLDGV